MKPPQRVNNIPLLGQQEQQAKAQIQAAIAQLSMQLYSQAAVPHLVTLDVHQALDVKALRSISQNTMLAAQCYFEGIGVITIEDGESGNVSE